MTENELKAAIASVTRHLERMGISYSDASRSMAAAAASIQKQFAHMAETTTESVKTVNKRLKEAYEAAFNIDSCFAVGANNKIEGIYTTVNEQEKIPEPPQYATLNYEKEIPTTILNEDYLTVYDPLKCDWDN